MGYLKVFSSPEQKAQVELLCLSSANGSSVVELLTPH